LALAPALFSIPALAQQQRTRVPRTSAAQNKDAERARRAQAINLLIETADRARLFDDLFYRARVQALAANELWPYDGPQARAIFRRAWEAATASDKAEREQEADETGSLPTLIAQWTEARDEVLRMVATRDAKLAETFLRDLLKERERIDADKNQRTRRTAMRELGASGAYRMELAYQTLNAGETRNAVELVAPLINDGVSADLIEFIQYLRSRSPSDADALYSRLIERAASDPQTDSGAVLLLSAPVVSPSLLVGVDESGSLQFRAMPLAANHAQQPIPSSVQAAFFNLAAAVLSRPVASAGEPLTLQDAMAQFYAIGRLLPFFENPNAPYIAYGPTLRARQSELFNRLEAHGREQATSQFGVSNMTQTGVTDPLRHPSEELARAANPQERERMAIRAVVMAANYKAWDRARRFAAEIEDPEIRRAALSFIQVQQIKDISSAYADEKEDDFESIVKFVRDADVPPFAKAWGMAEAATVAARKHGPQTSQKIAELIDEAENFAAHVEQGKPERVAAYGVVLTAAARFDQPRAWKLLGELVRSANEVEDFTGDETTLDLSANESSPAEEAAQFRVEAEVFRLDGIFATMARLDFDKALAEARDLQGQVPQALATIAVAKSRIQNPEARIQNKN
ncbi:MAG: hypothetical protein M3362_25530, partial [Acidobacteriota bacterium]|nr:hypothetical protein [Acidobacteriota bacterium]